MCRWYCDYKKTDANNIVDLETSADEEKLRNYLDTRVKIEEFSDGGRVVIDYFSIEELKRIVDKIIE